MKKASLMMLFCIGLFAGDFGINYKYSKISKNCEKINDIQLFMIDTQVKDNIWDIKIDSTTDKGLIYNVVSKRDDSRFKMDEKFFSSLEICEEYKSKLNPKNEKKKGK